MVISSYMDMLGVALNLLNYPITVFPLMPSPLLFDLCALPVGTMLYTNLSQSKSFD